VVVKASVPQVPPAAEEAITTTEAEAETKAFPQVVRTTNSSVAAATVEVGVKVEIAAAEAASPQSRLWSRQPDLAITVNSCRITSS
jgi:hypothetical protein